MRWERMRELIGGKGKSFYNNYPDCSKNVHRDLKEAATAEATEFTYITQGQLHKQRTALWLAFYLQ